MRSLLTYLAVVALTAALGSRAYAYTTRVQVTPDYVRKHPNRWSVKVAKKENGLIEFMIVRTLPQPCPMWQGTHLVVHHAGKVIAESNSLVFGRKQDYFLQFSVSPEDLAKSTFEFVEGYSTVNADDAMRYLNLRNRPAFPILRGPDLYQFRLLDLVPEGLLKTGRGKQVKLREPGSRVQQVENRIRELKGSAKTVIPEESPPLREAVERFNARAAGDKIGRIHPPED